MQHKNSRLLHIQGIIFLLLLLMSCKKNTETQATLAFSYLNSPGILTKVHSPIKVVITGNFGFNLQLYRDQIRRSVESWLAPLRNIDPTVTTEVQFVTFGGNVFIEYSADTPRSHAYAQEVPRINLSFNEKEETLLHEFGHAFGMNDTYVEGVWTCQEGQPVSVMCRADSLSLYRDDIIGIQKRFIALFPNRVPAGYNPETADFTVPDRKANLPSETDTTQNRSENYWKQSLKDSNKYDDTSSLINRYETDKFPGTSQYKESWEQLKAYEQHQN